MRTFEDHKGEYGTDYRKVLSETRKVLGDLSKYIPEYDSEQGYEIAGFIWFQGWNDGVGQGNPDYTEQMAHFIRDVRRVLKVPGMPFVIGELGTDGVEAGGWIETFRKQQVEIAAKEEFQGNVLLAGTAQYWPASQKIMEGKWEVFRAAAKVNSDKAKDDTSRLDPGEYYRINWEEKYQKELSFTSDKRYHYLGSAACYYQMGESMGKAMVGVVKGK